MLLWLKSRRSALSASSSPQQRHRSLIRAVHGGEGGELLGRLFIVLMAATVYFSSAKCFNSATCVRPWYGMQRCLLWLPVERQ